MERAVVCVCAWLRGMLGMRHTRSTHTSRITLCARCEKGVTRSVLQWCDAWGVGGGRRARDGQGEYARYARYRHVVCAHNHCEACAMSVVVSTVRWATARSALAADTLHAHTHHSAVCARRRTSMRARRVRCITFTHPSLPSHRAHIACKHIRRVERVAREERGRDDRGYGNHGRSRSHRHSCTHDKRDDRKQRR
jgi:hypothetical protein